MVRTARGAALLGLLAACTPRWETDEDEQATDDTGAEGADTGEAPAAARRVFINELMSSNATTAVAGTDGFPDWIELYNPGPADVDLSGCTITDDLDEPAQVELDDVVVPAGGYVVLLATGDDGPGELPFKLDAGGEAIGLFAPDGTPLDRWTFGGLPTDMAGGRAPDGGELGLLPAPTPGAANPSDHS
jgi:hypothetical protein